MDQDTRAAAEGKINPDEEKKNNKQTKTVRTEHLGG